MKRFFEWLELQLMGIAKGINYIILLIPSVIWLFVLLELFLYRLCINAKPEIFIIQFPATLWVLINAKKDK